MASAFMPTDGPLTPELYGLVRNGYGEATAISAFLDTGLVHNIANITAGFPVTGNIPAEVISGYPEDGNKFI